MAFTLQIGDPAPDFNLPGVDAKSYSLADFADAKLLIVVFSCNHCPYVVGSEDRIKQLYADYAPKGAAMIAINSNETENHPTDSFDHMVEQAKRKGLDFPYVRDESQDVAKSYGALRTPHFYVFDAGRRLRYTGRMDDNPREPGKQTTRELLDALDALLAGEDPPVPVTNPIGCNVKWKGQPEHWMPAEACDLV
ncbi:MAG TPA: thioredoxin family protein [Phycisphaerae bacterium]|nr:thioredoxin family protein [Phycisphaerae bacterium]